MLDDRRRGCRVSRTAAGPLAQYFTYCYTTSKVGLRDEWTMGLFSKFKRNREDEPVRTDMRPELLGLKPRDLTVMNEIAKRAADLSQPRHVIFFLYATSEETGQILAGEARARTFEVKVREPLPEYPGSWSVWCEQHTVLTPDFVRESVDFFEALAARHEAEYDGWEAEAA